MHSKITKIKNLKLQQHLIRRKTALEVDQPLFQSNLISDDLEFYINQTNFCKEMVFRVCFIAFLAKS